MAEKRMVELLDKYGKERVMTCIEEIFIRTEKAVRAEIAQWPEGGYYAEVKTDDDGAIIGVPITVRCRLTIKGGEVSFNFSDTDESKV